MTAVAPAPTFPDGEFAIPEEFGRAVRSTTGGTWDAGAPPPEILANVATLAASGLSIEGLLAAVGASVADGPMLGECVIVLHHRLRYGLRYRVARRFVSLERKRSARLGAMDVFVFVATLVEPDGTAAAEVTYTWILPRSASA